MPVLSGTRKLLSSKLGIAGPRMLSGSHGVGKGVRIALKGERGTKRTKHVIVLKKSLPASFNSAQGWIFLGISEGLCNWFQPTFGVDIFRSHWGTGTMADTVENRGHRALPNPESFCKL